MRWVLTILACSLAGCATVPQPVVEGPLSGITPPAALESGATGERARWGGVILATTPLADSTCFEVLGRPLEADGRPREGDANFGRFVACAPGFHDPAV